MNGSAPWLDKGRVRRAFEAAAARYDRAAGLQREVSERLLERLDWLRIRPRRVLDLGSGTGQVAAHLARRYPKAQVLALDLAEAMVRRSLERLGRWARWRGRAAGLCADMEALPLAAGSVDLVVSNLALQWCPDLPRALGEMRRVLAPGGAVLFSTFGAGTLEELRAAWEEADGGADAPGRPGSGDPLRHVHAFPDLHAVGDLLLGLGFRDPVTDVDRLVRRYRAPEELVRELKALGATNASCSRPRGLTGKGRWQRFLEAYAARRDPEGRIPATYEVVYGHAWQGAEANMPAGGETQGSAGGEARVPLRALADALRQRGER